LTEFFFFYFDILQAWYSPFHFLAWFSDCLMRNKLPRDCPFRF
jgi:hypothetical protein